MSRRAMVGFVMIAGLAIVSCGDDGGGGDGLGEGDDYSVAGALAELPASLATDGAQITTADLNAASEVAGVERPDDVGDVDAMIDWIGPLTGGPVDDLGDLDAYVPVAQVFNPQRLQEVGDFHDELGWSLVDADSFVEYATPPTQFAVVSGPYDDDTLSDDLIDLDGGIVTDKEGDDGAQDLENRSAVDDLGRPVRLARDGDRIAASFQTPSIEEWMDEPDETLADDEDLAAVADALDDAEVFSAYLISRDGGFTLDAVLAGRGTEEDRAQLEDELEAAPPAPFDTVGIGWSADDDGGIVTVAYQHADEDGASANAEALSDMISDGPSLLTDRPLSDLYELVDVETDGTVAIVTLRPGPEGYPGTIMQALQNNDVPFVHG